MRAIFLAFALLAAPVAAHPLAPAETAKVDAIVADVLKTTGVPSASVAVVRHGEIAFTKAYGAQSPALAQPSITARYPIASISKQITAAALLLLAEDGKLSLDDKVAKFVPGLTAGDRISIRQLLSHTSGYRDYWPQDYEFADMRTAITPQGIVDRWAKAPLDFEPVAQWQYSNTGYVVAGMIAEKAAGEPLLDFLKRRIFAPLNMGAVDADTALNKGDPIGHWRFALGPVRPSVAPAAGWLYAAGELAMTPSDLARWDIARIDRALLKPASWDEQETAVKLSDGSSSDYGLGVVVTKAGDHLLIEHGGEAVGFLSENRVYPKDRAAVIVFVNADFANAQSAIADGIEAMLFPDADTTARAKLLYAQLRDGKLDRGLLTANANYYFTPTALADYRTSLAPLGEPASFVRQGVPKLRGGFTSEVYLLTWPTRKLRIVLRAEPGAGGKVEQFMVMPAG
jgi:D-alanyl-D-alanine carboxypeptidase